MKKYELTEETKKVNGSSLEYVKNQTEEICLAAVKQMGYSNLEIAYNFMDFSAIVENLWKTIYRNK